MFETSRKQTLYKLKETLNNCDHNPIATNSSKLNDSALKQENDDSTFISRTHVIKF
jgi:hypothetical protein